MLALPGDVHVEPTAALVSKVAADILGDALLRAQVEGRTASLALSGGNSPREAYRALSQARSVDWTRVRVFWVDERDVLPTSERSNFRLANETLLSHASIPKENIFPPRDALLSLEASAAHYHSLLEGHLGAPPKIDVMVLGVGDDGHTASLFPHSPALAIADRWCVSVPESAGREARLSLTAPVLKAAREVVVLALGENKRAPLEQVAAPSGNIHDVPARILRECEGRLHWILDDRAATKP